MQVLDFSVITTFLLKKHTLQSLYQIDKQYIDFAQELVDDLKNEKKFSPIFFS